MVQWANAGTVDEFKNLPANVIFFSLHRSDKVKKITWEDDCMQFGDSELIRNEGSIRLLKIGARGDREVYAVLGGGSTKHFDDYEDALEEYNLRWMKEKYGE